MMKDTNAVANILQPLQEVLTQFAQIPSLIHKVPPDDRAYETLQMRQGAAYNLLEQLIAEMTVVYAPPKVGGQTIAATLWGHPNIPQPKHMHFMSAKGLAFLDSLMVRLHDNPNLHLVQTLSAHGRWVRVLLAANKMLRGAGMSSLVPKPIFIGGVREPMSQYLSLVFQVWWSYVDSPFSLTAESIRKQMLDDPWRQQCNNWFVDDLGETLGIDVFASPFPTEQGWEIYENDIARVLIIRQENLDRLPQALGRLYGIDPSTIKMETRNKAEDKDYSMQYDTVKKAWSPSERELDEVYSPAYVPHFYTSREIESFRRRWQKPAAQNLHGKPLQNQKNERLPITSEKQTPSNRNEKPSCGHDKVLKVEQPKHAWACHPCAQCAHELQTLKQRLKFIERCKSIWPVRMLLRFRRRLNRLVYGRLTPK